MQKRIERLDNSATHVFNSVASCRAAGYGHEDCESSQAEALDIAGELGTTLKYSSENECRSKHQNCKKVVTPVTTYTKVGDVMVPNTVYHTNYHPPVVGWQALRGNIEQSVPLYQGQEDNVAVRSDGAQFQLPAPR